MKTVSYLLVIFLLFSACSKQKQEATFPYGVLFQKNLKCMNIPRPDDSYNYPVYPGMKEWEKFETGHKMLDACQIPTSYLGKMSTQAIVQAIWEHPLLFDIFHRSQFQMDFESMFSSNNAFLELAKRSDAGSVLFERLVLVNPLTPYPRLESQTLELLISQSVFMDRLDDDQKKEIIKTVISHDELRQKNTAWADNTIVGSLRSITWLLVGRTMFAAGYTPFVEAVNGNEQLKSFLKYKDYIYMEELYGDIPQQIAEFSNNYLNE